MKYKNILIYKSKLIPAISSFSGMGSSAKRTTSLMDVPESKPEVYELVHGEGVELVDLTEVMPINQDYPGQNANVPPSFIVENIIPMKELINRYILWAIKLSGNNRTTASEILKVSPKTIYNRMLKMSSEDIHKRIKEHNNV